MKNIARGIWVLGLVLVIAAWLPVSGKMLSSGQVSLVLRSLANLAGLLAVYFILSQIVLISRAKWIEGLFGLDRLSQAHHILGFMIPFFVVAHPVLLVTGSWLSSKHTWLDNFLLFANFTDDVWTATVAAFLFLALVLLSVLIVYKKLKYETWYVTHLVMYLAVLLAFGHQLGAGDDLAEGWGRYFWYAIYAFTLFNLAYYRFFLPIWRSWRHDLRVDRVEKEAGNAVSIYLKGKDLEKLKVKAGQFFIFRFLDAKRWWQAHPFSVSCLPNCDYIRITIKALGDYTSEIKDLKPGTPVIIDGPHGVFTTDKSKKDKFLLLAGGVGITPVRSLAEELSKSCKDTIVVSASRSLEQSTLKSEMDGLKSECMKVEYIMSDDPEWEGERGFLTKEVLERMVPDYKEREIYFCGPKPMLKVVLEILKTSGLSKTQLHHEKFSL